MPAGGHASRMALKVAGQITKVFSCRPDSPTRKSARPPLCGPHRRHRVHSRPVVLISCRPSGRSTSGRCAGLLRADGDQHDRPHGMGSAFEWQGTDEPGLSFSRSRFLGFSESGTLGFSLARSPAFRLGSMPRIPDTSSPTRPHACPIATSLAGSVANAASGSLARHASSPQPREVRRHAGRRLCQ